MVAGCDAGAIALGCICGRIETVNLDRRSLLKYGGLVPFLGAV